MYNDYGGYLAMVFVSSIYLFYKLLIFIASSIGYAV